MRQAAQIWSSTVRVRGQRAGGKRSVVTESPACERPAANERIGSHSWQPRPGCVPTTPPSCAPQGGVRDTISCRPVLSLMQINSSTGCAIAEEWRRVGRCASPCTDRAGRSRVTSLRGPFSKDRCACRKHDPPWANADSGCRFPSSFLSIADRLGAGYESRAVEPHRSRQRFAVDGCPENRGEPFRRAKQIDVLADEPRVRKCVEALVVG